MRLHKFDPETGSFDYIATDDGAPAMTFYKLGDHGTYFQVVIGGEGSVNFDAKTLDQREDVDIGLWPQRNASVYVQSETRPNWIKITPSDAGGDIQIQTGGAPYDHRVGVTTTLQGAASSSTDLHDQNASLRAELARLEGRLAALEQRPISRSAMVRALFGLPWR